MACRNPCGIVTPSAEASAAASTLLREMNFNDDNRDLQVFSSDVMFCLDGVSFSVPVLLMFSKDYR
jgi:hypothetical protein